MKTDYLTTIQNQHTVYMSALMRRLKEIRANKGKDHALLIVILHEIEGDKLLSAFDFNLLKTYVQNDKYHETNN